MSGLLARLKLRARFLLASVTWRLARDFDGRFHQTAKNAVVNGRAYLSPRYSAAILNDFPSVRFKWVGRITGGDSKVAWALREMAVLVDKSRLAGEVVSFIQLRARWTEIICAGESNPPEVADDIASLDIVVPVFNNGQFLLGKSLPSLANNRLWGRMKVLVVDDGSDDETTAAILKFLEECVEQVDVLRTCSPPSGSASRPRNLGVAKSTSEWVSFLDPDNELTSGAYDELMGVAREAEKRGKSFDLVSGYQTKIGERLGITALNSVGGERWVSTPRSTLLETGEFPTVSTQAALIARSTIERAGISFVDSAIGQDTLFGWELIAHSRGAIFTDRASLIYYADRHGSVTNGSGDSYLDGLLRREQAQMYFLKSNNLLAAFRSGKGRTYLQKYSKLEERFSLDDHQKVAEFRRAVDEIYRTG